MPDRYYISHITLANTNRKMWMCDERKKDTSLTSLTSVYFFSWEAEGTFLICP